MAHYSSTGSHGHGLHRRTRDLPSIRTSGLREDSISSDDGDDERRERKREKKERKRARKEAKKAAKEAKAKKKESQPVRLSDFLRAGGSSNSDDSD